jgi:hypothetical protein
MSELYRTVFQVEVLSDVPLNDASLADVAREIVEGDASGAVHVVSHEQVSRERMAELLTAQGSDPAFLLGEEAGE